MRKILILFVSMLLVMAACSNGDNKNNNDHLNNSNNENNVENQDENNNDNINNETNEEENNNEENDDEEDFTFSEPKYEINEAWSIVPIDDSVDENVVLLTIDDAPENYALDMAKTLDELGAPAIFFVNGHFLETEEQKETLREIHDLGFVIGNHTYGHQNLAEISNEEIREEIVSVNDMVEEIIGERPVFFRAPFGVYSDYAKEVIKEENMTHMNWSYGYDWEADYMTKDAIADIMVNTEFLNAGSNLLMHDRKWTSEALEDIVKGLEDKGYDFVDPLLIKTN